MKNGVVQVTAQLAGYFDPTHNPESGDALAKATGAVDCLLGNFSRGHPKR